MAFLGLDAVVKMAFCCWLIISEAISSMCPRPDFGRLVCRALDVIMARITAAAKTTARLAGATDWAPAAEARAEEAEAALEEALDQAQYWEGRFNTAKKGICEVLFDPHRQELEAQLEDFMDANAEAEEEWYQQQALIEQQDAQIADLAAECDEAWAAADDAEAHFAAAVNAANAAKARLADAMDANAMAKGATVLLLQAEWERSQARYARAKAVMRLQQAANRGLAAERDEAEAAAAKAQRQRDSWRQQAMHMQLRFTARTMQLLDVSPYKDGASAEDDDNRRVVWLMNDCASALQQLADVPAEDLKAIVDGARSACDSDAALSHQRLAPADAWKQQLLKAGRLADALATTSRRGTSSSSDSADSAAPCVFSSGDGTAACDSQQVASQPADKASPTPQEMAATRATADDMQPVTPPLSSPRRCRPAQHSDEE